MQPPITHQPSNFTTVSRPTATTSTPNASIYELPSGEVLVGKQPSVSWEAGVGFCLSAEDGEPLEAHGKYWADRSKISSLGESWEPASEPSNGSFDRQDTTSPTQPLSPSEITSWLNAVTIDDQKLSPITHGSFERGVMGSMSVNDILMIKGLIDPGVYVDYADLEKFSFKQCNNSS
jgi:hypothetical protein